MYCSIERTIHTINVYYISGCIHHTFDVRVSGVRGLSVFNNTVWGEADCFVQYHFPSITNNHPLREDSDGTEEDYRERGTVGIYE